MDYAADMIAMENVNVTKMVDDIIQGTAFAFERKKMKFINNLPKDITIKGYASLIYSIFHNLIDNSLNYSGEGSTVTVGASNGTTHWHFTFADNGKGVDKSHLSRMFERFYIIDNSHDKDYKGTGLGLAIVKNAVQFHGGTINASIPKNGGLKFEFALKKK
jgi:two-component system OmpR family sensor kinase/two-component system phosphate regulon sensor histidine kinase PhoR